MRHHLAVALTHPRLVTAAWAVAGYAWTAVGLAAVVAWFGGAALAPVLGVAALAGATITPGTVADGCGRGGRHRAGGAADRRRPGQPTYRVGRARVVGGAR